MKWLTNNLFLKILSLVAAVVLWLAVVNISDAEGTKTYSLGVSLLNTEVITANGKVFRVEDNSDMVRVTIRARQSVLRTLNQADFTLTADMKKDLKYDSLVGIMVQCKNRDINVDEDVTLDRRNVIVSIEDSATEQFPVHVAHIGTPANGLVVGNLVPEQTVIKISGPVSIVERIKLVEALVDVTGLPRNTTKNCTLILYDAADNPIDGTYLNYVGKDSGIDVSVSLLNTKTVPLWFEYSGTPEENYVVSDVDWKPETIEIAGTAETLSKIHRLVIPREAVNVEGIDDELQLVVNVAEYLPSGIVLKNDDEASVVVSVSVEYVEPEPEEENEESEDSDQNSQTKPTTKPSDSPVKPEDKEEPGTSEDNNSDIGTEENPSADNNQNDQNSNNTENGENVKTEGNS